MATSKGKLPHTDLVQLKTQPMQACKHVLSCKQLVAFSWLPAAAAWLASALDMSPMGNPAKGMGDANGLTKGAYNCAIAAALDADIAPTNNRKHVNFYENVP